MVSLEVGRRAHDGYPVIEHIRPYLAVAIGVLTALFDPDVAFPVLCLVALCLWGDEKSPRSK